ncbi:MAG: hypothetical protein LBV00_00700 [Propionibacteriaceae bacterium]|jgi:hypothetical protein|nr:hypothetical protein [Propionibacteriaceae bacterium]
MYMDGPQETAEAHANERRRFEQEQNAVADCMAKLGFRYVPQSPPPDMDTASTRAQASLLALPVPFLAESRAQVIHDGYGVMGTPEARLAEAGMGEDVNATYQASLGPVEADAYSRALYGDYNDPVGTSAASCTGKAMAQFPRPEESSQMHSFQAGFASLISAAMASTSADARAGGLDEDERFVGINEEWEACMRTQGYTFEGGGGPGWAMSLAMRTLPDGSAMTIPAGATGGDIPNEAKSLLGTEPERKIAVDDFDCRVKTDYMDRLMTIRVARDEQFITEHQTELDRLVAAAESW